MDEKDLLEDGWRRVVNLDGDPEIFIKQNDESEHDETPRDNDDLYSIWIGMLNVVICDGDITFHAYDGYTPTLDAKDVDSLIDLLRLSRLTAKKGGTHHA